MRLSRCLVLERRQDRLSQWVRVAGSTVVSDGIESSVDRWAGVKSTRRYWAGVVWNKYVLRGGGRFEKGELWERERERRGR